MIGQTETLRLSEYLEGIGELIFEWDRAYTVKVYDLDDTIHKEFTLAGRTATDLFALIEECDNDHNMILG